MENKSKEIIANVLREAGIPFREIKEGEEGGFFYYEDGERKKWTENIFKKDGGRVELC